VRLLTYAAPRGGERLGALLADGARVLDVAAALGAPYNSMLGLIEAGPRALGDIELALATPVADAVVGLADVRLLAPLPVPVRLRDFAAFEGHARNVGTVPELWYQRPLYAKCNHLSVIGTGTDVIWPEYAQELDFELELACVIGRGGRDIAPEDAGAHIFGFTIYNDVSARDEQRREALGPMGPAKAKDFDTGNVLGPWIVTPDELGDPYSLTMIARVNGDEWSRGSTAAMHHRWGEIIAHASRGETLHAGEVLGSGTVTNGCGLELGRLPRPGDVVELEVERIGSIVNRFGAAQG
jgi:2-keto-4-pentenoate hydratase/2-oxohepta-3-ene-1,7-dioic acid hydratase in catechol pathway